MYGKYSRNDSPKKHNPQSMPPNKQAPPFSQYSIQDLFKGKNLELITAALLLTGKLKVDSVEIFRESPVVAVSLLGKYLTNSNGKSSALSQFLEENGDMTLDDVFDAFQKRMEKGR